MTVKHLPKDVNTIVVGNGPSALILSYILHGHIPYYNTSNPHPDPVLHQKLSQSPCLLDINVEDLTAHFAASRLSYSNQALPVNVLLDTLIRPLADTSPEEFEPCVEWRYQAKSKVDHIVVGNTGHAGGQWASNPVAASWDISALSYAEMLSLPGYSFKEHYASVNSGQLIAEFYRPTRREVADYLSSYPKAVGIRDVVFTGITLDKILPMEHGFYVASHDIVCENLVLASGTFTELLSPHQLLQPLKNLPAGSPSSDYPLLVIGSGFTAADIILSAPANRKIIHIYKWNPDMHPSPLRACHRTAYPEYASVYRRMKSAAGRALGVNKGSLFPDKNDQCSLYDGNYEGLPNTQIVDVHVQPNCAIVRLKEQDGRLIKRAVSNVEYVVGRRGSLDYLDKHIRERVLGSRADGIPISAQSLKPKANDSLEISPHVFAIGSLTGDSLIRFAYGGCVLVAKEIFNYDQAYHATSTDSCEVRKLTLTTNPELEAA